MGDQRQCRDHRLRPMLFHNMCAMLIISPLSGRLSSVVLLDPREAPTRHRPKPTAAAAKEAISICMRKHIFGRGLTLVVSLAALNIQDQQ